MKQCLSLSLALLLAAPAAQALPIALTDTTSDLVGSVNLLDDTLTSLDDSYSESDPPSGPAYTGDADVTSGNGSVAFAFGAAAPGELTTTTDITMDFLGADLSGTATSTASLSGDFTTLTERTQLTLELDNTALVSLGSIETQLIYQVLDATSNVLLMDTITLAGADTSVQTVTETFDLAMGSMGALDLSLISLGSADPTGSASNITTVSYSLDSIAAVPLPPTVLLLAGGLGLLGWTRRSTPSCSA